MTSRDYFKGKRIAVIGLGSHGEMVEDVKFLIKAGALVGVYDLKSEVRLKNHLVFLRTIGLANYICGSIPADDLLDMDLIVLSHEYPRDSSFLKSVYAANKARGVGNGNTETNDRHHAGGEEKEIRVEYPETLFFKLAPPVTVVGVLGNCGKATVISMLAPMLKAVCQTEAGQGFFVIDPESNGGILAHLKKIKSGDLILVRVIEPMMKELCGIRISPHVAIFTTLPSEGSYTQSPFEVLAYQTYNNFIIASDEVIDAARNIKDLPRAKMLRTKASLIPSEWGLNETSAGKHSHDRDNASLALQTARLFKIDDDVARRVLSAWKPLKGRLEFVKKVKNLEFYNDAASSSPASTLVALQAVAQGKEKNIILIFGGAHGANDYRALYSILPQYVHTVILLPGSGTMRERSSLEKFDGITLRSVPSIEESVRIAVEYSKKGDKVVFSPGFDAAGIDGSRKERGERFVKAVRGM